MADRKIVVNGNTLELVRIRIEDQNLSEVESLAGASQVGQDFRCCSLRSLRVGTG